MYPKSNVCCNLAASQFQLWIFHILGDQEGRMAITCQGKGRLQHFPNFIAFLKNVFDGLAIFCIVCEVMIFEREGCKREKVWTYAVMLVLEQT